MKYLIRMWLLSGLTAALVLVLACLFLTKQDAVEIEKGELGKWNQSPNLSLEFVRTIGETDSDDENLLFYKPAVITLTREGIISVSDAGNHRVQKFPCMKNLSPRC